MTAYFFDTSALVKRYHQEHGSECVDRLFADADRAHLISRLAVVEAQAAFALKVRLGQIDRDDFDACCQRLWQDIRKRELLVARVRPLHFAIAEELIDHWASAHSLRTLDALQLAIAKSIRGEANKVEDNFEGHVDFVCADTSLCRAAALEQFVVVNPEDADG